MANGNGNSNSGPTRTPKTTLVKKLQYTESILLNNATSTYSYYSKYLRPDVTKCVGASTQFAAYELWRIKKVKVSIQMANTNGSTTIGAVSQVPTSVIWTAADLGGNESVSGETIMQYQNAKRNTPNVNRWTNIVDTACNVNASLDTSGTWNYILPRSTWINTSLFSSSAYSGYQLFIQNFGAQSDPIANQASYTLQTELIVEFMQPAFQTTPSNFTTQIFEAQMIVQPDATDPTVLRTYNFSSYRVLTNASGVREFLIKFKREDGGSGNLTFTNNELRNAIETGTSAPFFDGRHFIYDGPMPPTQIPSIDYEIINN